MQFPWFQGFLGAILDRFYVILLGFAFGSFLEIGVLPHSPQHPKALACKAFIGEGRSSNTLTIGENSSKKEGIMPPFLRSTVRRSIVTPTVMPN